MQTETPTDGRTRSEVSSDRYQTRTPTLSSTRSLPGLSDRKLLDPTFSAMPNPWLSAWDYWVDAWQRTILFWDVLRQRSDQYYEQKAKAVPHVLIFGHEVVLDGRTFDRPVNYGLVRIKPPVGVEIDPKKRPFVV